MKVFLPSIIVLILAQPSALKRDEAVWRLASAQRAPFLDTARELVSIESGSRDLDGLNRIAMLLDQRLRALGGVTERVSVDADAYRMQDTPKQLGKMLVARFDGTGTAKILLMAHMDTVYPHGALASHPFKVDGDHAYGLGIADDKQGVALILHALAIMKAMNFRDYARITVAITADEELSTPGSRTLLTKLGAEHDAVISCEASDISGSLELATAGIGSVVLRVKGRASHAGVAPEAGRNALYELAHQILQMRDLSDPSVGRSLNWTVASAGTTRNVIPEDAQALGDVRVLRAEDYDWLEQTIRRRTADRLIPDTQVEATFERRRPPLVPTASSRRLAERAQRIFMELGKNLPVKEVADGAGTDAAFAAARTDAAVIEDLGVAGEGYHANGGESIYLPSIEPRLYLLTRLIITAAARSTN